MKNLFSFASLGEKFIRMVQRMPVSVLLIIGLTLLFFTEINLDDYDVPYQSWIFCSVGLCISITAVLWLEDHVGNFWLRQGLTVFCVALWGVYCLLLPVEEHSLHFSDWLQINVIGFVSGFSLFFISFLSKNKDRSYWRFSTEIVYQMGVSCFFGSILMGGLSLAVLAIDVLFSVEMSGKVYENLLVVCMNLFVPLYFLSNIPNKTEKHQTKISVPKILKILGLYILVPILAVYAVILYAYLIRIIVTWELPVGWVSWLVSALSIGSLFVVTLLYPLQLVKNPFIVRFSRYAGLFILPLLVLMSIGIGRRISDYGITINRLYILLLNIWFYGIYIYLYFSKAQHIKWILISPAVIFLLVSIGPWKFSGITRQALMHKMENTLNGNQFSLSDTLFWLNEMDKEKKIEIRETMDYLADTYGKESIQLYFNDSLRNTSMYEIFSTLHLNELGKSLADDYQWISYRYNCYEKLDIEKYTFYIRFQWTEYDNTQNSTIISEIEADSLHINIIPDKRFFFVYLKNAALKHLGENKTNVKDPISFQAHNYLILLESLDGRYYAKEDSLAINSAEGFVFYK